MIFNGLKSNLRAILAAVVHNLDHTISAYKQNLQFILSREKNTCNLGMQLSKNSIRFLVYKSSLTVIRNILLWYLN